MASALQLRVFLVGRVAVETGGRVLDESRFPGRQGRLLFTYLVAEQGRPVPRDELAEAFWGEAPPATWETGLTVIVSKLRALLADDGVVLSSAFGCYRLDLPEGSWVDLAAAAQAGQEAEEALAVGNVEKAKGAAELAAALLQHPFLPGEDGAWVEQKRRELTEIRYRALSVLADACLRSGDVVQAVTWADQATALASLRESGYRLLMEAHAASGNRAEALQVYERCRRILADELGTYPSPETESIYRDLLQAPSRRSEASASGEGSTEAVLRHDDELVVPTREPWDAATSSRRRRRLLPAVLVTTVAAAAAAVAAAFAVGSGHGGAVAAVNGNAIAIVDAAKARLVGSVPLDSRPGAIAYGSKALWVSSPDARPLTRVSPTSRRIAATVPLDVPAQSLAASGGSIWAVGSKPADTSLTLDRIDATFDTTRRIRRLPMVVAGDSGSLAGGRSALVVAPRSGALTRLDARSGRILGRVDPAAAPSAVAQGFGSSWLAYPEANLVVRIDATGAITTIPVGREPSAIVAGRNAVWVADALDGEVKAIDPATSSVTGIAKVGTDPVAIAEGDGSVWVANAGDGTLTRIDERTRLPNAHLIVGGSPQALVVADGKVWVSVQAPTIAQPSGGTIVVSVPSTATLFDPAWGNSGDTQQVLYAICSMLMNSPDEPGPAGLRLVPDAARAPPSVTDGGRTYTFVIRKGLRFSPPSNEPITARTFRHTIERSLSPRMSLANAAPPGQSELSDVVGAAAYIAGKTRHIAGVTARGDRLTIRLTHPAPDLPARLATQPFCAVPSDMPLSPVRGAFPSGGPYYIAAATPGRSLVLLRNPNYHGNRPRRPKRIDVLVGTPRPAVQEVEASKIDYAIDAVPPDQNARLDRLYGSRSPAAQRGRRRYFVGPGTEIDMVRLNTSRPLFASERMRRAVNYAVDRRALAKDGGTFYAHAKAAEMYLPPGVPGFRDEHVYPPVPDLAAARRLAGHRRHTAVLYCWAGAGGPRAAKIIAQDLHAIGIDVTVRCFPGGGMWERILTPHNPWDLAVDGYGGLDDPGDFLNSFADGRPFNATSLGNPRIDALVGDASRKSGLARAFAYARLDDTLVRDVAPWIVFANESHHDLFSARVGCQLYQPLNGMDLGALCIRPRG